MAREAPLVLPPLRTQADYVHAWTARRTEVDKLGGALTRSIDLLGEYKSSLITAAVTGELDVTTAGSSIRG